MQKIFSSASKLVLLYIVFILGLLTLFTGIWAVTHGELTKPEEIILGFFGTALSFIMGFYFGNKGNVTEPYAGK